MLKTLFRPVGLLAILSLLTALGATQAQAAGSCGGANCTYLPVVQNGCGNTNQSFGQWPRGAGYPPADRPADQHPDLNLAVRGYTKVTGRTLGLVEVGGATDPGAPQLDGLLNRGKPQIVTTFQIGKAPWDIGYPGPITSPDVTLIGFQVNQGELVRVPSSGYDIGGGFEVRVLYAASSRITFVYTTRDDVVAGYTIQVENLCVDPVLVNLYNQLNAVGRDVMPALTAGQPLGTTLASDLRVSIRDTGSYGDPRIRKDWWKNYTAP